MIAKPNTVHPIQEEKDTDSEPDLSDDCDEPPKFQAFLSAKPTEPEAPLKSPMVRPYIKKAQAPTAPVQSEQVIVPVEVPDIPGRVADAVLRKDSNASVSSNVVFNTKGQVALSEIPIPPPKTMSVNTGNIEALRNVGHLVIKQTNKDKEDFANVPNNYDIIAKETGRIFIGKEETHPEVRAKVRTSTNISQAFRMSLFDVQSGQEVLRVDREGVNVAPTLVVQKKSKGIDEELGVILHETGCLMMIPTYIVQDHTGKIVLRITGPPSGRLCHSIKYVTSTFDIFDAEGKKRVAKISKDGDFYVNMKEKAEAVTKEENLYIDFDDSTMDIKMKALILGTTFMLDFTYYKEPSFFTKLASFCCVVLPCCRK